MDNTTVQEKSTEDKERLLTERAYRFARRLMDVEKQNGGRVRVTIDLLMIGEEWWFDIVKPGKLERIGD